ncbi:response regulator [Chamaesiphon sp.]|uniref:response regulator n=1 Tax=Chamaesiphon sp. TaxID=2814140 RepID=UPI0035939481
MSFQEEYEFVEAAQAKTLEQYVVEIDRLDRAIAEAQAGRSIAAEAIANECAAQFYAEWGKEKIAAVYRQEAYDCFVKAGAIAKIADLEQLYPQLLQSSVGRDTNYFTDEFIATLSHEFRNPLNGILGMSEALLEEVFGAMNEQQLNAVSTIDRSGGYLLALINNMTDLSKIQVGKLELEITNVSVLELCQFSATFVNHHAIQKQIQLDLQIAPNAGQIFVDLQRMRQVLINLLNHAIDSTPIGGHVKLTVTRDRHGDPIDPHSAIQFAVSDTSKAIPLPEDDRQSLSPIDSSHVGLGLMLVNPIVELHGGVLSCQSIIGQGSYVKVSLPSTCLISEIQTDNGYTDYIGTVSGTLSAAMPKPPLILIVEDNELNINTISSYLAAKGYRPIVAQDGQSAIDLAQKHQPDLILMDIQMPGMDGLAAIVCIRQDPQLAEIPIIALTALAMEGDRDKCLSAGANDYLTKPVKLKQLNQSIQQWLKV